MCLSIAIERPDDVLSKGEHLGLQWVTVHNGTGYRCGYIRLPQGHPWHGKDWDEIDDEINVHGGITFAEPDEPCDAPGPDTDWWLGFDCAHACDAPDPELSNALLDCRLLGGKGCVRTQDYVEAECISLCEQAASRLGKAQLAL